jgi:phage shock protein A
MLVARHARASAKKKAHEEMRRYDASDAFLRFEQFESRIDRMEAEADLVRAPKTKGLEDQFAALSHDEDIERALDALKRSRSGQ